MQKIQKLLFKNYAKNMQIMQIMAPICKICTGHFADVSNIELNITQYAKEYWIQYISKNYM